MAKKRKVKRKRKPASEFVGGLNIPKKLDPLTKALAIDIPDAIKQRFTGPFGGKDGFPTQPTPTPRERKAKQIEALKEKKKDLDRKQTEKRKRKVKVKKEEKEEREITMAKKRKVKAKKKKAAKRAPAAEEGTGDSIGGFEGLANQAERIAARRVRVARPLSLAEQAQQRNENLPTEDSLEGTGPETRGERAARILEESASSGDSIPEAMRAIDESRDPASEKPKRKRKVKRKKKKKK